MQIIDILLLFKIFKADIYIYILIFSKDFFLLLVEKDVYRFENF